MVSIRVEKEKRHGNIRFDVVIEILSGEKKLTFIIEIEKSREDPEANVIKLLDYKPLNGESVILMQFFNRNFYSGAKVRKLAYCKYIADKLIEDKILDAYEPILLDLKYIEIEICKILKVLESNIEKFLVLEFNLDTMEAKKELKNKIIDIYRTIKEKL